MTTSHPSHEVVVVGGGVIGLAIAWRARARGLSVCVLERGALGCGASRVAAGMLGPVSEADAKERELLELGLRSARLWPAFAAELEDVAGRDVGYRRTGTLVVARDRDDAEALAREVALRERLGVAVEPLLPSAARRREPALAPTVRAAFAAPDDHAADPRALVAALAEAARRAGATLREGCEVARVEPGAGVVLADGTRVAAQTVVLAAGAWSARVAGLDAPPPVRPVKGQTLRLRPRAGEPPLLEGVVRWGHPHAGYLVPRADGRIVLGATMEERGYDEAMTAGGVYELLREASEVVPGVLELELEEAIAGLRPGTPDNLPRVGPIADGVLAACGHHRNGILLTPVTAEIATAHLCGEPVGTAA